MSTNRSRLKLSSRPLRRSQFELRLISPGSVSLEEIVFVCQRSQATPCRDAVAGRPKCTQTAPKRLLNPGQRSIYQRLITKTGVPPPSAHKNRCFCPLQARKLEAGKRSTIRKEARAIRPG